jgi:hypothetical protein
MRLLQHEEKVNKEHSAEEYNKMNSNDDLNKAVRMAEKSFAIFDSKEAQALLGCMAQSAATRPQVAKWRKAAESSRNHFEAIRGCNVGDQKKFLRLFLEACINITESFSAIYTVLSNPKVIDLSREPCFEEFKPFVTKLYKQLAQSNQNVSKILRLVLDELLPVMEVEQGTQKNVASL